MFYKQTTKKDVVVCLDVFELISVKQYDNSHPWTQCYDSTLNDFDLHSRP